MFSIPQDTKTGAHGDSDENPLILYDEPDDFRALCWIIYALPKLYMDQFTSNTPDMKKLVSLYLIAHKYHFETHESLARHLIHKSCTTNSAPTKTQSVSPAHLYFAKCPESRLRSVMQIATLTRKADNGALAIALQRLWIQRLQQTSESVSTALEAGETLGLRNFLAESYYLELIRTKPVSVPGSDAYALHVHEDLTPRQKLTLYQGNWSLRIHWTKIVDEAPKPFGNPSLDGEWKAAWERLSRREAIRKTFDPLEALATLRRELTSVASQLRVVNFAPLYAAVDRITSEIKTSLPVHFLGPIPVAPQQAAA
ncbi:hypothetical protein BDN70DRAFT_873706 [Pholiota conissans]|uniref:Uncharacterized protein n=1 Tax=Pholiota conissans TaxID=109636 RepID=A0A9P6CY26_9AGAR|nr:hypothetical protein BDN70DRAFT_873706 [Pholiota conissans]